MTLPEHPDDSCHHASADDVYFNDGVPVQRILEILCQIEMDRMREEHYLVSVIGKLRLLNCI
ncbi:MAG: hypothetical protein WC620_03540 [Methanoregula sp.]|jgi:hypothetical protein